MKKLIALLLALVMCLPLAACGGVDVQPAIDAYNQCSETYNKFAEVGNEHLEDFTDAEIDELNACADALNEYAEILESDTEFTQEEVDEMVALFNELTVALEEYIALYE